MGTFCNIDKYAIVNKSVYIRMSNTGNQPLSALNIQATMYIRHNYT